VRFTHDLVEPTFHRLAHLGPGYGRESRLEIDPAREIVSKRFPQRLWIRIYERTTGGLDGVDETGHGIGDARGPAGGSLADVQTPPFPDRCGDEDVRAREPIEDLVAPHPAE